ncbi:hypothetical protein CLTEP_16460 [Clostridium tepidiprofundi DSM 19306]|uniref:Uncharacterized protein n=1 Tax=Clostridium tepidiprofundi DSM 19306 TaxID=1121338 RepID=A0A151B3P8_9CLOT|nr:hypothetical protein [Clostridium tepidiprofundi]KYH34413.1 hypothetical protein CLTEP_16460 [Clostridium tepidiprofundi DSM 19306]
MDKIIASKKAKNEETIKINSRGIYFLGQKVITTFYIENIANTDSKDGLAILQISFDDDYTLNKKWFSEKNFVLPLQSIKILTSHTACLNIRIIVVLPKKGILYVEPSTVVDIKKNLKIINSENSGEEQYLKQATLGYVSDNENMPVDDDGIIKIPYKSERAKISVYDKNLSKKDSLNNDNHIEFVVQNYKGNKRVIFDGIVEFKDGRAVVPIKIDERGEFNITASVYEDNKEVVFDDDLRVQIV